MQVDICQLLRLSNARLGNGKRYRPILTKFYRLLRSLCSIPLCLMWDTSADGQAVSSVPAGKCSIYRIASVL